MTMHLCGPALSLNGKKKGKFKYRNAEEAKKARELDAEWKELLKRQGVEAEKKKQARAMKAEPLVYKLKRQWVAPTLITFPAGSQQGMTPRPM